MYNKLTMLFIISLTLVYVMVMAPAAAAISKPAVPEFTVKFVEYPYDVPAITTIDPYTGNNVTAQAGYRAVSKSIQINIKNEPYSYTYNGSIAWLVYNVRIKGHFEADNWTVLYSFNQYMKNSLPSQSSSGFTNITLPGDNYSADDQVDFQVEALTEYETQVINYPHLGTTLGAYYVTAYAIGETSGWSSTQTITISDNSTTAKPGASATPNQSASHSQNPTAASSQPGAGSSVLFGWNSAEITIAALLAAIAVLLVFVVVYLRRRSVR